MYVQLRPATRKQSLKLLTEEGSQETGSHIPSLCLDRRLGKAGMGSQKTIYYQCMSKMNK